VLSEIWQIFQRKKRKEKLFELTTPLKKDPTASQKKKEKKRNGYCKFPS
jgi:hypothetical protein